MGEPYLAESGACSYTHTRLTNSPYEVALYMSLLHLSQRDIACTCKGGLYPNRFKKHEKSAAKHIEPQTCLGRSVPYLTVSPCLSQEFVAGGNSVTV